MPYTNEWCSLIFIIFLSAKHSDMDIIVTAANAI